MAKTFRKSRKLQKLFDELSKKIGPEKVWAKLCIVSDTPVLKNAAGGKLVFFYPQTETLETSETGGEITHNSQEAPEVSKTGCVLNYCDGSSAYKVLKNGVELGLAATAAGKPIYELHNLAEDECLFFVGDEDPIVALELLSLNFEENSP